MENENKNNVSVENTASTNMNDMFKKKLKLEKRKKLIKKIVIIGLVVAFFVYARLTKPVEDETSTFNYDEYTVSYGDVNVVVQGDGVIEANSIYTITPKVTGEILNDYFEVGDFVKKGDLLYSIDSKDINSSINQANLAVEQSNNSIAQSNISLEQSNVSIEQSNISLEQSKLNYENIKKQFEDLNIYATSSGFISNLIMDKGTYVNAMTQVCEISEKDTFEVVLPFRSSNSKDIHLGDRVSLLYLDYYTYVDGYVTKVNDSTSLISYGAQVTDVTIEVKTTGYSLNGARVEGTLFLSNGTQITSIDEGKLESKSSDVVVAKSSGTVKELYIEEGSYVNDGDLLAVLENTSLNTQLENAEMNIKNAEMGIKNAEMAKKNAQMTIKNAEASKKSAQNSLSNTKQQLDNYNITSPISGQIVYKNSKKGDVISTYQKSNSNIMATIADLSVFKFDMQIDELEIRNVKVGQSVLITIEALDNKQFTGHVSNINVIGNNIGGSTNYTVTIEVPGNDEIYSGMTIDAKIDIANKTDVIRIPLTAVRKGDIVYKKSSNPEYQDSDSNVPLGYEAVKVELGLNNSDYIEITKGLSSGDIILTDKITASGTFSMENLRNMMVEN